MKRLIAARDSQSGFTLIELSIVLAIIGILAAVLVPTIRSQLQEARIAATIQDLSCLRTAFNHYALENPDDPLPVLDASYETISEFGRQNGCWMAPPNDDRFSPPYWIPFDYLCVVYVDGVRLGEVPCSDFAGVGGFELCARVPGVSEDVPGHLVLLSSVQGIQRLSLEQRQQQTGSTIPLNGP